MSWDSRAQINVSMMYYFIYSTVDKYDSITGCSCSDYSHTWWWHLSIIFRIADACWTSWRFPRIHPLARPKYKGIFYKRLGKKERPQLCAHVTAVTPVRYLTDRHHLESRLWNARDQQMTPYTGCPVPFFFVSSFFFFFLHLSWPINPVQLALSFWK